MTHMSVMSLQAHLLSDELLYHEKVHSTKDVSRIHIVPWQSCAPFMFNYEAMSLFFNIMLHKKYQ